MTDDVTDSFRREHEQLSAEVAQIRAAALEIPRLSLGERAVAVDGVLAFLRHGLGRHAESEERSFYPQLGRILGDSRALAPMVYDHQMIGTWTAALAQADLADTQLLQELLFGLHAVIKLHLWKEEEIYFPLLDANKGAPVPGAAPSQRPNVSAPATRS